MPSATAPPRIGPRRRDTRLPRRTRRLGVSIRLGDALELYPTWPRPTVIVSDGPYGLRRYPGDPPTAEGLGALYEPHVRQWSERALPSTTLWFWNSELGWATVHPLLARHGWEYRSCHVWNKGRAHVAGNANSRTLRKFPVVTEVCVQYVHEVRLPSPGAAQRLALKDWLRREWERTGLPLTRTNEACGVLNAATRKYFATDHLWYFPPADAFDRLAAYANRHGDPAGRPYFSADGRRPLTGSGWRELRAKFRCLFGITNVWTVPPVNGEERIKRGGVPAHANQKPLELTALLLRASSDPGDTVWEPFGGMCTAAIAALLTGRRCCSAEILPEFYALARRRLLAARTPARRRTRATA